ncbi:hypothetical protein Egran_06075, partial [Elaphomyces granulatus]
RARHAPGSTISVFPRLHRHLSPSRDVFPSPKPALPIVPVDSPPKSPTDSVNQPSNPSIPDDIPPDSSGDKIVSEHATTVADSSTTSSTVKSAEVKPTIVDDDIPPMEHLAPTHNNLGSAYEGKGPIALPSPRVQQHWKKMPEHFPIPAEDLIQLPSGQPKPLPKLQYNFKDETSTEKSERLQKLATAGIAIPSPGATLVDALDTLWIMDLREGFAEAVDEIRKIDFTTSERDNIPLFETVIRYLGGLVGAYDISGYKYNILLDKAIELAEILMGAFDTPNRMPLLYYRWASSDVSRPHRAKNRVVLAELGSLLVEFTRLAQLTKENKYYAAVARITDELEKAQSNTSLPGLWPLHVDTSGCKYQDGGEEDSSTTTKPAGSGRGQKQGSTHDVRSGIHVDAEPANYKSQSSNPNAISSLSDDCEEQGITPAPFAAKDEFGLGALADSTYEYLPKEYMLLGGLKDQYRTMYEQAMDAARKYLFFRPMTKDNRDILFVAKATVANSRFIEDEERLQYEYEGTHLTCFTGGMFGIGAKLFGISGDMNIAKKLIDGCIWAYQSTNTGIMPESFEVLPCKQQDSCVWDEGRYNKTLDPYADQGLNGLKTNTKKYWSLRRSESWRNLSRITNLKTRRLPGLLKNVKEPLDDQTAEKSEQVVKMSEDTHGKSNKAYQTSQQGSPQVSEEDEYPPVSEEDEWPPVSEEDEHTPTAPEFIPPRPIA